jgi:trans-aconitate 2-methyltransferase
VGDPWSPGQYERFKAERERPFLDLLALVPRRPGMRAVDLGCGTGEPTRRLHETLGCRETVGVDASPAMLARAAGVAGGVAGLRFTQGAIESFDEPGWDLLLSNAAIHWVDHIPRSSRASRGCSCLAGGSRSRCRRTTATRRT